MNEFKVGDSVRQKSNPDAPKMTVHYLTVAPKHSSRGSNSVKAVYAYCQWFSPLTCKFESDTFHFDELVILD